MHSRDLLIFARYYIPGTKAGGPIRSIQNLSKILGKRISLGIITSDRDYLDPIPYENIEFNKWITSVNPIYYCSRRIPIITFIKQIRSSKTIYINSFFDPTYSILPLLLSIFFGKKIVLTPRGELAESALNLKSFKKSKYIKAFKFFGFKNRILWHATNLEELAQIHKIFGSNLKSSVASNISLSPANKLGSTDKREFLDLFYLGRVAKIKNLKFALEILSSMTVPVRYSIYGPIDDEVYWDECQMLISKQPSHVMIEYRGVLQRDELKSMISTHEFLFLPTLGENFGHAIAESLSMGTPVIISDKTPWKNLPSFKAGWDIPLENKGLYLKVLNELSQYNSYELRNLKENTLSYYSKRFEDETEKIVNSYCKMFKC